MNYHYNNLFKKGFEISPRNRLQRNKYDHNVQLYFYFLNNDEIVKDKFHELGIRDVDKKVKKINEGKRFFLEYVGDNKYFIIK